METLPHNHQDTSSDRGMDGTGDLNETPSGQNHHTHSHDEASGGDHGSHKKVEHRSEKEALIKRMNRIAGQVNGVTKMIQEDRYCVDVLVQISAIKSALDGVAMHLLEDHTRHCVRNAITSGGGDDAISELIDVIRKYTR